MSNFFDDFEINSTGNIYISASNQALLMKCMYMHNQFYSEFEEENEYVIS